jgi:hypothetical protein
VRYFINFSARDALLPGFVRSGRTIDSAAVSVAAGPVAGPRPTRRSRGST